MQKNIFSIFEYKVRAPNKVVKFRNYSIRTDKYRFKRQPQIYKRIIIFVTNYHNEW